ncbi:hypothetical protein BC834DRAFT_902796 [Gloeopeniophorella convolvens]|nr:hypothetical protein BC834DRAFT_902796 [Gloeopeniophorella convolvens]
MVVMSTTHTQEALKILLCAADDSFFRVPSTNPRNTYTVLRCHTRNRRTRCKVDILVPPLLNIPLIPAEKVEWDGPSGVPVMPVVTPLAEAAGMGRPSPVALRR